MTRCKNCSTKFEQRFSSLEKFCWDPNCKLIEGMQKLEKAKFQEKKEWREKKSKIKKDLLSVSDYLKIAQQTFNKFIRIRDKNEPCISCGKELKQGNIDAGHYYSSGGHSNVRFDEMNVFAQCSRPCNKDKSGDLINYGINLENKIGKEEFIMLRERAYETKRFTKEELIDLIALYKQKIKEIEKG